MKLTSIIVYLLIANWVTGIHAQTLSQSVLANYHPSVSVKVYDILSRTPINEEKQLLLAEIFKKEDSILYRAAVSKMSQYYLNQTRYKTQKQVQQVLSDEELTSYLNGKTGTNNYNRARSLVNAFNAGFGVDSFHTQYLITNQYLKLTATDEIIYKYEFNDSLANKLDALNSKYDTVFFRIIDSNRQTAYFNHSVSKLDSIQPLDQIQKTKLRNVFSDLCTTQKLNGYETNFKYALQKVISDTIYAANVYKAEIDKQARYYAMAELATLQNKYTLNKASRNDLTAILFEKEKEKFTFEYAFGYAAENKIAQQAKIIATKDSLINRTLFTEGINTPQSDFFTAIQNKRPLKLTKQQVDSLTDKGFELENKMTLALQPNSPAFDNKNYARENISRILSEDQYTQFLSIKNKDRALFYAKKDWNDILQYGLAQPSDSAGLFKQIEKYQLARCVATERFVNDPARRLANHQAIDASIPEIMEKLKASKKWSKKGGDPVTDKKNQGTYQW